MTTYSRWVSRLAPMDRLAIFTKRPTPCCSWTTKSPGLRASGSTEALRRAGSLLISRVEDPPRPVMSAAATRANLCSSMTKPEAAGAAVT